MEVSSTLTIKNIYVFGWSCPRKNRVYRISKSSWSGTSWEKDSLVYRGGSLGLMGSVSIVAFLGGSQVLGVVFKALGKGNIIGKTIREEL